MIDLTSFCKAVEATSVGKAVYGSSWLFPAIETIHLSAMVALVGSISAFDLRLLGFAMRRHPVSQLAERLLPVTWIAFGTMAVTGVLLFTSQADSKYCHNGAFQIKMMLILLAGVNMMFFHFTTYRSVKTWDINSATPIWAKLVGTISVLCWAGVVVFGRWIGFD
jgi:Family of unknown function (DUF6644)